MSSSSCKPTMLAVLRTRCIVMHVPRLFQRPIGRSLLHAALSTLEERGGAQVLRRDGFLRRDVAKCFPLSAGRVTCSDMHNLFAQKNGKRTITKKQSVYAVTVVACEMAS